MEQQDIADSIARLTQSGYKPHPSSIILTLPPYEQTKKDMMDGLVYFLHDKAQWQPEYDNVARWLSDNQGKGLLCVGDCGRGKSLITMRIIPILLHFYMGKVIKPYDANEMNTCIDKIKKEHIVIIDDIGTENMISTFGNKRAAFPEVVDAAEKNGILLIVSTNLSSGMLREKYGERVLDRMLGLMRAVKFTGRSMRT